MNLKNPATPSRRVSSAALAILIAIGGMLGLASPATAAPLVTYPDAISNIHLAKADGSTGPLNQWETVKITADWSVPDGAKPGETFGMTLPEEFSRAGTPTFDITDPDTGAVMATCAIADGNAPEVVCTLSETVAGKENIGGSLWMSAEASRSTTNETVTFDINNKLVLVDLPGEGGIITEDLTEPVEPVKYSSKTATDGRFMWSIRVPASSVHNGGFAITDRLDPTQESHTYTGDIELLQRPVEDGKMVEDWSPVDPGKFTVDWAGDMKSFSFAVSGLEPSGFIYILQYYTQADGLVVEGDTFGNSATVDNTTVTAIHRVDAEGGGTGTADQHTRFTITKKLTGEAAALAADATYTVRYSVSGSTASAKTMTLPVGTTIRSDRVPLGSTFRIEEINFPTIAGVTWGAWTLSGEGVSRNIDGTYSVAPGAATEVSLTLTNDARVPTGPTGSIAWTKVNPDGDLLAGSEWELIGPDGTALSVTDNGTADANPKTGTFLVEHLVYGTYTLTEKKAPAGYVLLSEPLSIVVDAEHTAATFGAIHNLPIVPVPSDPEEPGPPALAHTGFDAAGGLGLAAILAVVGSIVLIARRRTLTRER
ncbi:SpaA isopeptide-forming pilin-related protein [Mycetocola saprophilus]|uniref:SpaA isopeptide-forming pilin-related protein n=1 Tax=Mycetocola saprophilus TaxID=76636 RepID=UPI0004C126B0|nr:Ig-like domain-containing protein [Mycetocola saprophilus]